ncbi:MAG: ectoine hydroxylase [Betaproteobacteria bacterium]|jgi:ectoine hydroxylase
MAPISDNYRSRTNKDSAIISRREPVVYSNVEAIANESTKSIVHGFERDGYALIEDLFSEEEVSSWDAEIQSLAATEEIKKRDESFLEPGSTNVRSIFRVHMLSDLVDRLVRDPRLLDLARTILGSDVYVHQSRANLKPGFRGKEFYWHSDFETWHVEDGMPAMRAISCSVLLTDNDDTNGPLMLMPGSQKYFISCVGETPDNHYKESLKKQEYGVPDDDSLRFLAKQCGIKTIKARAGSVVFFDCNTMHGSNSNISPFDRRNLFFVYNSVENSLEEPKYGLSPRPEYVATRESFEALRALKVAA